MGLWGAEASALQLHCMTWAKDLNSLNLGFFIREM